MQQNYILESKIDINVETYKGDNLKETIFKNLLLVHLLFLMEADDLCEQLPARCTTKINKYINKLEHDRERVQSKTKHIVFSKMM